MQPYQTVVGSIVCAALAAPACVNEGVPPPVAKAEAPMAGAPAAPLHVAADDDAELAGAWEAADWGQVTINGRTGSYTDTYGTGPGRFELRKTGDHMYSGVWGESKARHGTLTVTLSSDGRKLTGTWAPDTDVTIGGREGGPINWVKKR
jgi:hypothetical protein